MLQLAWRFLMFQKDSALAQWFQRRAADRRPGTRKTMIVALAHLVARISWADVWGRVGVETILLSESGTSRWLVRITAGP